MDVPHYPTVVLGFELYLARDKDGNVYFADAKCGTVLSKDAFEALRKQLEECGKIYNIHSPESLERYNRERFDIPIEVSWPGDETAQPPKTHLQGRGYVYLMERKGEYKIGASSDPEGRAWMLGANLLHVIKVNNMLAVERRFQQLFADRRLHGEWFALSERDIKHFCSFEMFHVSGTGAQRND